MTPAELTAEVNLIVKRPDLATQVESAIKNAVLKLHLTDFYSKDAVDYTLNFGFASYTQIWTYKVSLPRYRATRAIFKVDLTTNTVYGKPLDWIDPTSSVDEWETQKSNVFYEAGQTLVMRFSESISRCIVSAYQFPAYGASYGWIADDYGWAVVFTAAATVFKSIGHTEQEASMRQMAADELALIKLSNVQPVGY